MFPRDLGLSFTQAGVLGAANTGMYALMQIPSGVLADRFGLKRLFLAGLLGTSLLTVTFALLDSYLPLVANQAASGLFRSLVFAPGLLLITGALPSDRGATAMGMYVAGGFTSNIVLNTVGPFGVEPLGWRNVLFIGDALSLVFVYLYWRMVIPARKPPRWTSAFATSRGCSAYLVMDKRLSLTTAGFVVAFSGLMTAPANILGGLIADRLGPSPAGDRDLP